MRISAFITRKIDTIVPSFFKPAALVLPILLLLAFSPLPTWGQDAPPPEFSRGDPDKYKSAEECGECHELEFATWEKTRHAIGFKEMHKEDSARKIAKKLGYRRIKANSLCIACHYTPTLKNGQLKTTSGVSCEACHGPGKDWIKIHNDYGGKEVDYKTESPEHRAKRVEASRQAGMMRPSDLYPVVENCFQCHLVPNEKLVNVGGHGTGTGTFEFVKMANEIRHNFLLSVREGSNENTVRPVERLRLMYVVGQTVQLEYVLRSLAVATENGTYSRSMIDRVSDAMADMSDLSALLQVPELKKLEEIVEEDALKPNNKLVLLKAADTVSAATRLFLKNHDGSRLKALDSEIFNTEADEDELENELDASLEEEAKDEVALDPAEVPEVPDEPEEVIEAQDETQKREAEIQGDLSQSPVPLKPSPGIPSESPKNDRPASVVHRSKSTKMPIQGESESSVIVTPVAPKTSRPPRKTIPEVAQSRPPAKSPRRLPKPSVVGKKKSRIRPGSKHKTLGPRSCGKCHSEQTEWWLEDKHKNTHKPFKAKKGKAHEKALKIAKLYGVKPSEMAKGTQVCMNCHGTVISKKKKKKVRSGVSCESCHGPAKAYLKPHEDGEKEMGVKRPGYLKGLKLGLVKLKDEAIRAKTCASCHYITDKRLISSGHSSGEKFKYAKRVKEIKHWESKLASPAAMNKAYQKVIVARGPVPKVAIASAPKPESRPPQAASGLPGRQALSAPAPEKKITQKEAPLPTETLPTTSPSISQSHLQKQAFSEPQPKPSKVPPLEPTRVLPIPEPVKKQKQSRPAKAKIDEAKKEAEEETDEALDPEDAQAVQELIIRDASVLINEAIKKLDFGEITFDAPLSMQVNETQAIALAIPLGKTIKELNGILKKDSETLGLEIQVVGSMVARLSGRNFSIATISPETQALSEGSATEWKWEVSPTKEGSQNLHVSLSALINVGGKSTLKVIRAFDQKVEIRTGLSGKVKDYFLNNWQWVWAIAFFSGIAWWRGKKSG